MRLRHKNYDAETPYYSSICCLVHILYKFGMNTQTYYLYDEDALNFMRRMHEQRIKNHSQKK